MWNTIHPGTSTYMPGKEIPMQLLQKIGHYSKVCRSAKLMWQTQQIRPQQNRTQQNIPQAQCVRIIRATTLDQQRTPQNQDTQSENNDETIDLENTFFIQEVFNSWNAVKLNKPKTFKNDQPSKYSPTLTDKIWLKTTSDGTEIDWLADTGSPRSFIGKKEAKRILLQCISAKWKDPNEGQNKYRCFNNIEIPITGTIQLKLRSGQWETANNEILVVNSNTVNLLGRDILGKLGFTLSQNKS